MHLKKERKTQYFSGPCSARSQGDFIQEEMMRGGGEQLDNNTAISSLAQKQKGAPVHNGSEQLYRQKISIAITALFAIVGFDVSQKAEAPRITLCLWDSPGN